MDSVPVRIAKKVRCKSCGQATPAYDITKVVATGQSTRDLCSRCFNTETAQLAGMHQFEHIQFEPVRLADSTGKVHTFHFQTRLFGPGISIDAFEVRKGSRAGYQFRIIGKAHDDQLVLLGRLIEKIRRALSTRHIEEDEYGAHIANQIVQGNFGWDEEQDGDVPLLIIDGREITWQQLGHMLMTYEGFQFKLEIRDQSLEF